MSPLTRWTAGLVGERDPAQPLITYLDGSARVELSGVTTANWVAKNANLLVDGLGQPARIGLLLPLHWQTVTLLLAGVTTGAQVVLAASAGQLRDCDAAFTTADEAESALEAGPEDVLAVSVHPLGAPGAVLPPLVIDHAREVPGYGDLWTGPPATTVEVTVSGAALDAGRRHGLGPADRVLLDVAPADPAGLQVLLDALAAGAAVVLAPGSGRLDLAAVARDEGVTAAAGVGVPGARALLPPG